MFLRPFSEDPAARPASALPVPGATRPRAGHDGAGRTLRGKGSFAFVSLSRQKQVGAAISGATFRFPQKLPGVPVSGADVAFSERACTRRPLSLFRAFFRKSRGAPKGGRAGAAVSRRKGRALRLPRVAAGLRFFVRRFARRRSSARTCAFVRGAGAEGRFSESAASCGVCAFSRAAGGPAYSKPRLRR